MSSQAKAAHHLLVIGPGYTAEKCLNWLKSKGFRVTVAARRADVRNSFSAKGVDAVGLDEASDWPSDITHILSSVAPPREGENGLPDPILAHHQTKLDGLPGLQWIGYLSSTNVYGDRAGGSVDETTKPAPTLERGKRRLAAEEAWLHYGDARGIAVHLFRLAGIYGPGRSALDTVKSGRARRIIKEGQLFSRIHVDDIAQLVGTAALSGLPSGVFNGADNEPAPPQDVIEYAAKLLGAPMPPAIPFEEAALSPMAKSFYAESKKVVSGRLEELGITLKHPTYKDGLEALHNA